MGIDVNWACGDYFAVYTNIESLCCIPETNTMLKINPTYFFTDFIYLFLKRGEGKEKEERNIDVRETGISCLSHTPRLGNRAQPRNPGMCPDWESN